MGCIGYQVQFLRAGFAPELSVLFDTFQDAHSYAAREIPKRVPKVVSIVEIQDDGNDGRIHDLQVF
jgi:hypothetical protein